MIFLAVLAEASRGDEKAIAWLKEKDLIVFIQIAMHINQFATGQTFDHHKIPF